MTGFIYLIHYAGAELSETLAWIETPPAAFIINSHMKTFPRSNQADKRLSHKLKAKSRWMIWEFN